MRRALGWVLLAFVLSLPASAQVQPTVANKQNPFKVTIAVTSTFQQALPSASRFGCTIQYVSSNTGFVIFQNTTPADTTTSFQLSKGQTINCAVGGSSALTDQVLVTGTNGDIFVVSVQ